MPSNCKCIPRKAKEYFKKHPTTLNQLLKKRMGKEIKVGSGCDFVYCGPCDKHIFKTIKKLSDLQFNNLNHWKERNDNLIANHIENWDAKRDRIRRELKKKDKYSDEYIEYEIEKTYSRQDEDYIRKLDYSERLAKAIENYVPFGKRRVIAEYEGIDFIDIKKDIYDCLIIIFDGNERGMYMSRGEYLNGVNIKDLMDEDKNGGRSN